MRLLNTSNFSLEEFEGSKIPRYAILSHTWSAEELTYQEMMNLNVDIKRKSGFVKAQKFCNAAQDLNFTYVWMDTCCIDKRSSAELTEAINSMFMWYQNAELCLVHLEDMSSAQWLSTGSIVDEQIKILKRCRWFTRGWTLQELIASRERHFMTSDWQAMDIVDEAELCFSITNISSDILSHTRRPTQVTIAERMSWAAERETTRSEDRAYSLMGLFQVNMPVLYGEGLRSAFRRLQEEIMRKSFDQTLFAWHGAYESSGLLARSPEDFRNTPSTSIWPPHKLAPFHMTNAGIVIRPGRYNVESLGPYICAISIQLQCNIKRDEKWCILSLRLKRVDDMWCWINGQKCEAYRRIECSDIKYFHGQPLPYDVRFKEIVVLEDEHFELAQQAVGNMGYI